MLRLSTCSNLDLVERLKGSELVVFAGGLE
jgi:hypothetical protein